MEPERQKLGAFLETVRAVMGADDEGERWRTGDIIQRANTSAIGDLAAQAMRMCSEIVSETQRHQSACARTVD
jgi:hypothetical protein